MDPKLIVLQANQNRIGISKDDCCIVTLLNSRRVGTNIRVGQNILELLESDLQFGLYGNNSYEYAVRSQLIFSDELDISSLEDFNVSPLHCSDIRNLTGSTILNEQYVERYGFDLSIGFYEEINNTDIFKFNKVKLNTTGII